MSKICVIIDPAHGINTAGKGSPYTLNKVPPHLEFKEYLWSREICLMLATELEKIGLEVCFTVTGDEEPGLLYRYMTANSHINQHPGMHHIFISIHNNAAGNGSKWCNARGWSAYTTPGQNNSDKFAECLYDAMEKYSDYTGIKIRTDKRDGDRDIEANFAVLKGVRCPAVLTENLFQDNEDDVLLLQNSTVKKLIVKAHVEGILKFIDKMGWSEDKEIKDDMSDNE